MKLYHGTSYRNLAGILRGGLRPRRDSKHKGNHAATVASPDDRVYLSDIYGVHYACHVGSGEGRAVVLELEIDPKALGRRMLPDEDFLEQSTRTAKVKGLPQNADTAERVAWFRDHAHEWQGVWLESLKELGTCAVTGGVPASSISRYAVIDLPRAPFLHIFARSASVILLNHRFCHHQHAALTELVMGKRFSPMEWVSVTHLHGAQEEDIRATFPPNMLNSFLAQAKLAQTEAETAVELHPGPGAVSVTSPR